ncbi:MAG TPA: DNA repair protein RecN [Acidobacteriaceae bacterium]|jgi:DNA repair protein RecN (Recombination protein N)|nr:DNA repair protein RecN [Acidobacteriaceae bacterium]
MLLELRAENYAVIDHAIAGFGPGLNLLTGETGAGKSILVDALALLMGQKATTDIIRHGADRAVLSCVFESTAGAELILEANGLDAEGSEIILRREILDSGKGRVYVNNQPATVAVLRALAPELALIHAQSETISGFDPAQQRILLDRFAGMAFESVEGAFARWREIRERLAEIERDEQDRLRLADLWSFQAREIQSAAPQPGEDEALATEKRVLANAEKLQAAAMGATNALYDDDGSAEATLLTAQKHLEELARYDSRFQDSVQQLVSARAAVEDVASTVRDYADSIDASPERLAEIEDRLAVLDRLKRKYGAALDEVIRFGEESARKLAEIENRDEILKSLHADLAKAATAYQSAARTITAERTAAAKKLEKLAESQINDLAMKARFSVVVTPTEDPASWTAHGWDAVECRIATNPGEPLQPLDQIASGGEMSRVLLALKVSVEEGAQRSRARKVQVPRTLVFDEIDIGIGGRAAEAVGQKLKALSRVQQVLCVTHLPQIAAFADQHFLIEKQEKQRRTQTSVRLLASAERAEEIARMISGATVTETSLRHAEQMLKSSASAGD